MLHSLLVLDLQNENETRGRCVEATNREKVPLVNPHPFLFFNMMSVEKLIFLNMLLSLLSRVQ
jgi:hypothetical protein